MKNDHRGKEAGKSRNTIKITVIIGIISTKNYSKSFVIEAFRQFGKSREISFVTSGEQIFQIISTEILNRNFSKRNRDKQVSICPLKIISDGPKLIT